MIIYMQSTNNGPNLIEIRKAAGIVNEAKRELETAEEELRMAEKELRMAEKN